MPPLTPEQKAEHWNRIRAGKKPEPPTTPPEDTTYVEDWTKVWNEIQDRETNKPFGPAVDKTPRVPRR